METLVFQLIKISAVKRTNAKEELMQVIQIIGPSYSGSTVLGYALNTVDGYFFGSEVRRLLRPPQGSPQVMTYCNLCGQDCEYWDAQSVNDIGKMESLTDLYCYFSKKNDAVKCFIDASKSVERFVNTEADSRIICVKHPIRLVASTLHNLRKRFHIAAEEYSDFKHQLGAHPNLNPILNRALNQLVATYTKILDTFPDARIFNNDMAHIDDFKEFREIETSLGLSKGSISPSEFSKTPCHSIGGNRAPVWISLGTESKDSETTRNRYYAHASRIGDWRIDDKYQYLLEDTVIDMIEGKDSYKRLLDMFGYPSIDR